VKVTLVLAGEPRRPSGGAKVQLQYANELLRQGHEVTVLFPASGVRPFDTVTLPRIVRYGLAVGRRKVRRRPQVAWYPLASGVQVRRPVILSPRSLPQADVTVFSAWQTVIGTRPVPTRAGRLAHIVYDYELWMTGSDDYRAQMAAALQVTSIARIATSGAVEQMLDEIGTGWVATIRAGLEDDSVGVDCDIRTREPVVGFPLRGNPHKGMQEMADAARVVHRARPDARLVCFGDAQDIALPDYVVRRGSLSVEELRSFYNGCRIFVLPSRFEGWGLPGAEAMACGCALVTTANGGTEDFAISGVTALVVPPQDPFALASAVLRLLDDDELRCKLARAGVTATSDMSVGDSGRSLADALTAVRVADAISGG
jgi:glycosyltransferase involved in cell wall biosynthesis